MELIFTDFFDQEIREKFGITREHVRRALDAPDSQSIIKLDDIEIGFYIKRVIHSKGELYLLVATRKNNSNVIIDFAFKILPGLINEIKTIEPIIVLQELVQINGLSIRICNQSNKFIMREMIPIDKSVKDVTQVVEIRNPSNHSLIQTMFLKIEEQGENKMINCALAFCIDTDKYLEWLQGKVVKVTVEIAPQLKGYATPIDLITSSGTIVFTTVFSEIIGKKTGFLFRLLSEKYTFEVGFSTNAFYIQRNSHRLEFPIVPIYKPLGIIRCYAMWSPHELSLLILDETYGEFISSTPDEKEHIKEIERRKATLVTPITFPPNSLIEWARNEAIAPLTIYDNKEHFYEVVTSSMISLQDKISAIDLHNPFWDITYDGLKIISRKPKHETDIHPTIHGLLYDIAIAKNFQIYPEYPIAGGRLDFLISGVIKTGDNISICVEFKSAHSDDLENGLLKQLPAYMRAKGCDYGLYCVLFFKGPSFSLPSESKNELEISLHGLVAKCGHHNIRVIILDLSQQITPSNL